MKKFEYVLSFEKVGYCFKSNAAENSDGAVSKSLPSLEDQGRAVVGAFAEVGAGKAGTPSQS